MTDSASPLVDLDLRLVGYFVVVAEHRHFGRAATALRVAQPSLSPQVHPLEAPAAAHPSSIVIGYTPGVIVTPAVRELRREHPDAEVQALHVDWDQGRNV